MALNIYHVERPEQNASCEEYIDFVVICRDEETARRTHPNGVEIIDPVTMKWVEKVPRQPNRLIYDLKDGFLIEKYPDITHWVWPEKCKDLLVTRLGVADQGEQEERVVMNHYVCG
jgi:hypothetical protein